MAFSSSVAAPVSAKFGGARQPHTKPLSPPRPHPQKLGPGGPCHSTCPHLPRLTPASPAGSPQPLWVPLLGSPLLLCLEVPRVPQTPRLMLDLPHLGLLRWLRSGGRLGSFSIHIRPRATGVRPPEGLPRRSLWPCPFRPDSGSLLGLCCSGGSNTPTLTADSGAVRAPGTQAGCLSPMTQDPGFGAGWRLLLGHTVGWGAGYVGSPDPGL